MEMATLSRENIEKFVELIKRNPVIFNITISEHKDAMYMYNVWDSISEAMQIQHMNAETWKRKYRNLRDCYVRCKRALTTKSEQDRKPRRKWIYFDLMSFLDPYIESNSFSSPGDAATVAASKSECDGGSIETPGQRPRSPSPVSFCSLLPPNHTSLHKSKILKRSTAQYPNTLDTALQLLITDYIQNTQKANREKSDSAERAFFDNCRLRTEKLAPQFRSYVQLQISQILFNAENPHLPPIPITPLPPVESSEVLQSGPDMQLFTTEMVQSNQDSKTSSATEFESP